ncbi:hypothetical protein M231_03260 [Tremella mesenterica]|uniref:Uncharacterized protein n=1 Tax=Tremella mesenterica TaxID=5217 RepID=A0A4V1M479_TREME|nr:hypothetical protein M231_03260 [Tremella mesenterica]
MTTGINPPSYETLFGSRMANDNQDASHALATCLDSQETNSGKKSHGHLSSVINDNWERLRHMNEELLPLFCFGYYKASETNDRCDTDSLMGHAKWACKEHLPTAREIFCSQVETLGFKTCGRTTQVPIITGILDKEENLLIPPIPLFQMTKVDSDGTEQLVACCSLACAVEHVLEGWTKRNMSDDPLAECQERISNAKGIGLLNYGPEAGDTLIDMEPMREKSMNAWSTESKGQSDEELSGDSDNASVDNESAANPEININDKNTDNADDDGDSDHTKDLQDGSYSVKRTTVHSIFEGFIEFTSTSQLLKALMGEVGEQISESIHPLNDMGICICNSQKRSSAAEIWTTKVSSKFVSSCKHDGDNFRIPVAIISEVSGIGDMVTVQVLYPMKRILADGTKEQICHELRRNIPDNHHHRPSFHHHQPPLKPLRPTTAKLREPRGDLSR